MAAERGAQVVLAARSEDVLARIAAEIGLDAAYVAADVGRREDVEAIADKAEATFGGFGTWVSASFQIKIRMPDLTPDPSWDAVSGLNRFMSVV